MQLKNKRLFPAALIASLVVAGLLAGCSSPSATTDAGKTDAAKANAAPGTIAPVGEGSTTRDQNLKNMPDDVRARLQSQGQPVK